MTTCLHGVQTGAGYECATCVTTPTAAVDAHEAQNKALRNELLAIRQGITDLLANPWVPSSDAIRKVVFYPVAEEVEW